MTMDLECEGPGCEDIQREAEEALEETSPQYREWIRRLRRNWRTWRPSFVEFFVISYLDMFHPYSKESVFWETYVQEKGVRPHGGEGNVEST